MSHKKYKLKFISVKFFLPMISGNELSITLFTLCYNTLHSSYVHETEYIVERKILQEKHDIGLKSESERRFSILI